jgi:hypothetical protein
MTLTAALSCATLLIFYVVRRLMPAGAWRPGAGLRAGRNGAAVVSFSLVGGLRLCMPTQIPGYHGSNALWHARVTHRVATVSGGLRRGLRRGCSDWGPAWATLPPADAAPGCSVKLDPSSVRWGHWRRRASSQSPVNTQWVAPAGTARGCAPRPASQLRAQFCTAMRAM